uniref:Uncharacterized protein n=1 Tax=Aegilops tauschii subsp. strangulata TaxID=200361 RepID=A0A453LLQ3_AEGTS
QTLAKSRRRQAGERTRRRENYSGEKKKPWQACRRIGGQGLEEGPIQEEEINLVRSKMMEAGVKQVSEVAEEVFKAAHGWRLKTGRILG